jgi:hypothetical protein
MTALEVAARTIGGLWPFSTPLDTPCRTPLVVTDLWHCAMEDEDAEVVEVEVDVEEEEEETVEETAEVEA